MVKHRQPVFDITWQEFGRQLLETKDLDPVYCCLVDAYHEDVIWSTRTMRKLLLAYWCFYSVGVAAYVAEQEDFWLGMWRAFQANVRGTERRHFRGIPAYKAIAWMKHASSSGYMGQNGVLDLIDDMCDHATFKEVYEHSTRYPMFGPWIAWKIADMAERVLWYDVDFSDSTLGIYRDPKQAAALIIYGDKLHPITDSELDGVIEEMVYEFRDYAAPPYYDRPINIQEAETVLCKYKSHCYGSYPMGKDIREVTHGLHGWGELAESLVKFMPEFPN